MKTLIFLPLFLILASCSNDVQTKGSLGLSPTESAPSKEEDINQINNLSVNDLTINPSPANFGTVNSNSGTKDLTVIIKNTSASKGKIIFNQYLQNFAIANTSTCIGSTSEYKVLNAGQSCNIIILFDSSSKVGLFSENLILNDFTNSNISFTLPLYVVSMSTDPIVPNTGTSSCKPEFHTEGRQCLSNLRTKTCGFVSPILNLPVHANYNQGSTYTQTYSLGSWSAEINSYQSASGDCSFKCEADYDYNASTNSCNQKIIAITRSCVSQPSNSTGGTETSLDNSQTWSSCSGFTCNSGYKISGASCIPDITEPTANFSGSATTSDGITSYGILNNELYIAGANNKGVTKLFKWTPTGLTQPLGAGGIRGIPTLTDSIGPFMTTFNNNLYFSAAGPELALTLYKFNGTTAVRASTTTACGTANCSDLAGYAVRPIVLGNKLYYSARMSDSQPSYRLHSIDTLGNITNVVGSSGTRGNSTLNDSMTEMEVLNSNLYFRAVDSANKLKLYTTTGSGFSAVPLTPSDATITSAIVATTNTINFSTSIPFGNGSTSAVNAYGAGYAATNQISTGYHMSAPVKFKNTIYFIGTDGKIYKSLGYSVSEAMVGSVTLASKFPGNIVGLYSANNMLFIAAYNAKSAIKLYKLDENNNITQPFGALGTTGNDSTSDGFGTIAFDYDGSLFITANNPSGVQKLYSTPDTGASIQPNQKTFTTNNVAFEIAGYCLNNYPIIFTEAGNAYNTTNGSCINGRFSYYYKPVAGVNNQVKLSQINARGVEGFTIINYSNISDNTAFGLSGTSGSTTVDDSFTNGSKAFLNGSLYFAGINSFGSSKLYKWDGTTLSQPLGPNGVSGDPRTSDGIYQIANFNNALYFQSTSGGYGRLHKYDGTTASALSASCGGNCHDSIPTDVKPAVYNNELYYVSRSTNLQLKLHKINSAGTITNVVGLSGTKNNSASTDGTNNLTVWQNRLYFTAFDNVTMTRIYYTTGSSFTQALGSGSDPRATRVTAMTVHNDMLYYVGYNDTSKLTLGSFGGNGSVSYLSPSLVGVPVNLFPYAPEYSLYLSGLNAGGYSKLYIWDELSFTQPLGINGTCGSASCNDEPTKMINYNGIFYFSANNINGVKKLFAWDGVSLFQPFGADGTSGSPTISDEIFDIFQFQGNIYVNSKNNNSALKMYKFLPL